MDGERTVDAVEHPLVDHVLGAVIALFTRLEHEPDLAGERVLAVGQDLRGADQHRHVGVVPAGVHAAVVHGLEVGGVVLLQREGIHVATQQSHALAIFQVDCGEEYHCAVQLLLLTDSKASKS